MVDFGEGYKYQRSVTAYLASLLSKDRTVKNYHIFYEQQDFHPFDDIVLVVKYHDSDDSNLYCIQVKSGKIKLEINKYMKGYYEIIKKKKWKCLQNIGTINEVNIQFWYFACQKYSSQTTSFQQHTEKIELHIKTSAPGNRPIIPNNVYKLFSQNADLMVEHEKFFEDFHIFFGQHKTSIIANELKDMWKSNEAAQIIEYFDKYFTRKSSMNKEIFEDELLRICLNDSIVTPVKTLPFKKESAIAWNNLTLSHNVTIVKTEADIEMCIFGSILQCITKEITIDEWNRFVDDGGRLSKEYKEKFVTKLLKPETLKDLLIHMWTRRSVPLVLRSNNALQSLKEFSHLDQHYIIIDSDPKRRFNEMINYSLSTIKHLGDGTDELLQSISISMQGREPEVSLYAVINGDKRLTNALTCSDILKLIEPRKVYLNKDCLKGDKYMLFIIEVENQEDVNLENFKPNGDNITILCHFDHSNEIYDKIRQDSKFKDYKIYRLRLEDGKLMFASKYYGNLSELNYFLIDQYGNSVYSTSGGTTVPILGKMEVKNCLKYLPRHMRKGNFVERDCEALPNRDGAESIITFSEAIFPEKDFFKEMDGKICIVVGEAGIGKTTLLQSLLETCDCQYYVLFCNLARFQSDIRRNTKELFDDPLNFLWNKHGSLSYKNFLNTFLKGQKRVILMLDSFDEVVPTCKEQVLKLLRKLTQETCLEKIVIGSRLLAAKILKKEFSHIGVVKVEHFTREHNGKYIENWGFDEQDLEKMPSEFGSNPLYLDMLRQISRNFNIDLHNLNSWILYQYIVDLNITRYCQRIGQEFDDYERENILKFHWELAVKLMFGSNRVTEKFTTNRQTKLCNYARLGFIKYINENEEPEFVHYTFAEFFVTNWLIETADVGDTGYIYEIMVKNPCQFPLRIHSEQFPLHKIINNSDVSSGDKICDKIRRLCEETPEMLLQKDGIGRTALHLAAHRYRVDLGLSLETIIQCMREKGYDLYSRDKLLNWTWIDICENDEVFCWTSLRPYLLAIQEEYWRYHASFAKNSNTSYVWKNIKFDKVYRTIMRYPSFTDIMRDVLFVRYFENKNFDSFRNLCLHNEITAVKLPKYFELAELQLTPLHIAVIYSNINVVTACLRRGDNVNAKDTFGCTPLYHSIAKEQSEIVKLLLIRGARIVLHPDIRWGFNTFQLSLQKRNKSIIKMLIEKVNIKKFGPAWLCDSIKFGDLETVEMLLKANADPNGGVLVYLDTHFQYEILLRNLLELCMQCYDYGFDINAMTVEMLVLFDNSVRNIARTPITLQDKLVYVTRPLQEAVYAGREDIVELLLKNDADVNSHVLCIGDELNASSNARFHFYFCTPLYCAIKYKNMEIIELLLKYGAKVYDMHKNCLCPLIAAINNQWINYFNHPLYYNIVFRQIDDIYRIKCEFEQSCHCYYIEVVMNGIFKHDWTLNKAALLQKNLELVEILFRHGVSVEYNSICLDDALEKRNWTMIEFLLEKDVNAQFSEKVVFTNLIELIPSEHVKIIELLLKKGADPNMRTACDVTPLYVAARKRNPDIVRLLLENGATTDIVTCTDTLVAKAKERGEIDVVMWLWDFDDTCSVDPSYDSGRVDEVSYLIRTVSSQVNINLVDEIDITRDITTKKMKFIERLLEYAADLTHRNGTKCINAVCELKNKDVDQILIQNFMTIHKDKIETYTAVGCAAFYRNQAMFEILSRNGENVNTANKEGVTPLDAALREGDEIVVKFLLENGADVNLAAPHSGDIPLIVAISLDSVHFTNILIENKAIINNVSESGITPLIRAIIDDNEEICKLLLKKGADVNFATDSGLTPLYVTVLKKNCKITDMIYSYGASSDIETCGDKLLFHAIISRHYEILFLILTKTYVIQTSECKCDCIAEKVLRNRANVNAVNDVGLTPLHLATQMGWTSAIKLLLLYGADPNRVDQRGQTPLHYAVLMNSKDIVKLLLIKAELTIKDNDNLTPLDYAKFYEYRDIVNMMMKMLPRRCCNCTMM